MNELTGTGRLIRLALRRDRTMLPIWIVALVGVVASTISAFGGLYPDQASRGTFALSIRSNTTFRAFYGPLFDDTSNGGLTSWRVGTIGVVIVGLMSIFLITRHTRQEEESGRLELLGSAVLGRRAPLTAALIVAVGANLTAGLLSTAVLVANGEDAAGSLAMGVALSGGGLVFAGVAGLAAQLTESTRAANSIAVGVLALSFALRAAGDSTSVVGWLTWLSPIGWAEEVRPFAANRLWLFGLPLVAAGALAGAAAALNGRRDLGGGLLPTRLGPARASRSLTGPLALVWRLQRANLAIWTVAFMIFGAIFGSFAPSIGSFADSSPQIAEILRQIGGPGALIDAYFVGILAIMALIAAPYGVSAMLRIRADETNVLVEPVLATAVPRSRLLAAHAALAFGAPAVLVVLAGISAGITANASLHDGTNRIPGLFGGAAAQIPAIWVICGLAALLFGVLPRWTAAAWGGFGVCALLAEIGASLRVPQIVMDVSPFAHTPKDLGHLAVQPLVVLLAVGIALTVAGFVGFRRRDIG